MAVLLDNLACLQDELVILEAGEEDVRKDKILLEEVGPAMEEMIRAALSAQWGWEGNLEGDDLEREIARRRGLHFLGVGRGWELCVWCGEYVGPRDWASGRLCAHQIHVVSTYPLQSHENKLNNAQPSRDVRLNWGKGEAGPNTGSCAPEDAGKH